jgi:uncharacterized protein (TIGR02453 family)
MAGAQGCFKRSTFQFFRDLGRNNRKAWMDENRERYQECVVRPFRQLLEELTPALLRLDGEFDIRGKTGVNFSRINRDIRFAKDKTPYKTQMYLKFERPCAGNGETGQLYLGVSAKVITAGFRIYVGGKRKESILATIAEPRVIANPKWVARQKKRLGRKYESYWYSTIKGEWTKHEGWPTQVEEWKKIQAWIVRRKLKPSAAGGARFAQEIVKVFKEVYPLLKFTSVADAAGEGVRHDRW